MQAFGHESGAAVQTGATQDHGAPDQAMSGSPTTPSAANPPVALYQELGHITRQLHDSLAQLGVMPRLQEAAQGLPDARSRLGYVVDKTAQAAHRVLNSVDAAKAEHRALAGQSQELLQMLAAPGVTTVPLASVLAYVQAVQASTEHLDRHLTDIMLAQDFHDLTGQVVRKVLEMANALEDSLVQLLVQAAPEELAGTQAKPADGLQGPVVDGTRQGEVVHDQGEVDDLLASLGF